MLNWYDPKKAKKPEPTVERTLAARLPDPPSHLLQFFAYTHLPKYLQEISKPFGELAEMIIMATPRNPEQEEALRKLLEAKDCAVRSSLMFMSDEAKRIIDGAGGGAAK